MILKVDSFPILMDEVTQERAIHILYQIQTIFN